jgi:hypothetical protein
MVLSQARTPSAGTSAKLKRLVSAFEREYAEYQRTVASWEMNAVEVYHLRRGVQALVDMWRATGNRTYLRRAHDLTLRAMQAAQATPRPMHRGSTSHGEWPCFFHPDVEKVTGGHSQGSDFQGASGFLIVAASLREAGEPGWREIVDFVEAQIIEKWLRYRSKQQGYFSGPESRKRLLSALNQNRDNREHFANICLDLSALGCDTHPYREWAEFLVRTYLSRRSSPGATAPDADTLGPATPLDWGLLPVAATGGLEWYWLIRGAPVIQDTSHANRTVWLASKAHRSGLIERDLMLSLVQTLKKQVWARERGPFTFNNYVDGSNGPVGLMGPSTVGNVWFGWHRLAAYDDELRYLYLGLAEALAHGGKAIPTSQNKAMIEARLCLIAWGARLLSPAGRPLVFP